VIVVVVLVSAAVVAGVLAALAARFLPEADPSSPRAAKRVARWELSSHPAFVRARVDPRRATGLALTIAAAVVVIGAAVYAAIAVMVATTTGLEPADRGIERWADSHATSFATSVLKVVTDVGATWPIIGLVVVVAVVESIRIPSRAIVPFLFVVTLGQTLLVSTLKGITDRARPAINPVARTLGASFPSGHTAGAAACLAAVALLLGRQRSPRTQATLVGIAVGLAVAVATTRVLLGLHWVTDAIAGLAIGWVWFAVCAIAFGGRLLHFGAPIEIAERADDLHNVAATSR
jgi:membrane-associated phospholipid phosphatase